MQAQPCSHSQEGELPPGKGVGDWQGLRLLHGSGGEGAGIAQTQLSKGCAGAARGDTSVPHMGSASWEHPWEGWREGHALPRSSPRKKQWQKSISRIINHPERGYGGCKCLWEKQNPKQLCQELAPARSHCGPAPGPKRDVCSWRHQPNPEQSHGDTPRENSGIFLRSGAPSESAMVLGPIASER